jgi:hypothetical protein
MLGGSSMVLYSFSLSSNTSDSNEPEMYSGRLFGGASCAANLISCVWGHG